MKNTFARSFVGLFLLLGSLVGCATDKQVIAQASDAHREINPAVVTDPVLDRYIQSIGDRVVDTAREMHQQGFGPSAHKSEDSEWMFKEIQFHLVNSPTLNAFTTGGQHVYLYSELFTTSKTEDEFAAVGPGDLDGGDLLGLIPGEVGEEEVGRDGLVVVPEGQPEQPQPEDQHDPEQDGGQSEVHRTLALGCGARWTVGSLVGRAESSRPDIPGEDVGPRRLGPTYQTGMRWVVGRRGRRAAVTSAG